MTDTGDAIADIATGAVLARAVEPGQGAAGDDGHSHESACLNCGTALIGRHCHACGQAAHVHKTLGAFFHDLLHGVFHFEGKIWRTLPMLAWHPGRLTREYIDGRRASYVSPIALFLFVVFLTFALFNMINGPIHFNPNDPVALAKAEADTITRIAELEKELVEAEKAGEQTGGIEGNLVGAKAALDGIRTAQKGGPVEIKVGSRADPVPGWASGLSRAWQEATKNPDLAIYKVQSSAYKYSWLLIPMSVPFVWVLFPFSRRFRLYDHTIFVTYSLSFMLMVIAAITAINVWTTLGGIIALLVLYMPFHMHRHLRGTYQLSRRSALWRTVLLSGFAMIALTLFGLAVLGLSIG